VLGILRNEKYCGDALCQKTVTVDFFTHKSVKNNGIEPQYFIEDHHEPIIDKTEWKLAQAIRLERRYTRRSRRSKKPRMAMKGRLQGFYFVDPSWHEEDLDEIYAKITAIPEQPSLENVEEDENFVIVEEQ